MKTKTPLITKGASLGLIAAIGLLGTMLAAPAMAKDYRGSNHNRGYSNGYGYQNNYDYLNRINRYGVRGKIVAKGRGYNRNCFRVKRTGKYQYNPAIITVRYCTNHYGNAQMVRGSKRLVKYINAYRPARGHSYRTPNRRY